MNLKDVLQRDPSQSRLANNGQARLVDDREAEKALEELREELKSFVCEGHYAEGLIKILRTFLAGGTSLQGAWVSGFYGSGKSLFLKIACHLWVNTPFPDGSTARTLVVGLPEEVQELLRDLDIQGRRSGGLLAAAGAMPNGGTDAVRLTVLAVILRAADLPEQYAAARFCLWLHSQGKLEEVRAAVEAAGKNFHAELNNLYVSPIVGRALLAAFPGLGSTEGEVRQLLKAQFPQQRADITTAEFLDTARQALKLKGRDGQMPLTLLALDEIQQYIADVHDRSILVSEVAEAVSKQLDGKVMIVGAGQSALSATSNLRRLMGRFTLAIPLSDIDVETVTRRVLLQKKPAALTEVRKALDNHAGEVSRHLRGTRIAEREEDRAIIVDDYPMLPVRRRFFDECFRQLDAAGTQSQLRSQLRIIHDALAKRSQKHLGVVIPADELYEALAPEMVNTGVLLREINERIIQVRHDLGSLAARVCGVVFLINKLKRDAGLDTGVRATKEHIADLLVDDLAADNGKLRAEVEDVLKRLADRGDLMPVEDEFRLQTREGAEWDREFKNQQARLLSNTTSIYFQRDQLLYAEVESVISRQTILHGASKVARKIIIHRGDTAPAADNNSLYVWIRDGWSCSAKQVEEAARAAGNESATIFVFIPQRSPEELRRLIIDAVAAKQTLDSKGIPSTREGEEAKLSMESRLSQAAGMLDRLVKETVSYARVFQGGGAEITRLSLPEQIQAAADDALVRLFPRFDEGDAAHWETVIKRAREGADSPFQVVGYSGPTHEHAVCKQVLATVGAGRTGADLRKDLQGSPFGWPKDAIDAALIALHRVDMLTAVLNGVALSAGQLDQNKIAKADFRKEGSSLTFEDKMVLRKLYQSLEITSKTEELGLKAPEFLSELIKLATQAGGEAPLPPCPSVAEITDLQSLIGQEQLAAIRAKADILNHNIPQWREARDLAANRSPAWRLVTRMARHAVGLDGAQEHLEQMEAIRSERLLLEPMDPVAPIRAALAALLREAVGRLHGEHQALYDRALAELAGNDLWQAVSSEQQNAILAETGLMPPVEPNLQNDEALLHRLDEKGIAGAKAENDAIPRRVQKALELAARLLEPQVRSIALERATLRTSTDVEAWLTRARSTLIAAVDNGPVLIG